MRMSGKETPKYDIKDVLRIIINMLEEEDLLLAPFVDNISLLKLVTDNFDADITVNRNQMKTNLLNHPKFKQLLIL